jgi:hypothetical protein
MAQTQTLSPIPHGQHRRSPPLTVSVGHNALSPFCLLSFFCPVALCVQLFFAWRVKLLGKNVPSLCASVLIVLVSVSTGFIEAAQLSTFIACISAMRILCRSHCPGTPPPTSPAATSNPSTPLSLVQSTRANSAQPNHRLAREHSSLRRPHDRVPHRRGEYSSLLSTDPRTNLGNAAI